jgi:hypothetical protein
LGVLWTGACAEETFDDPCGTLVSSTVLYEVERLAYADAALFIFARDGVSRHEVDAIGTPTWRSEPLGSPASLTYVDGELHAISYEGTTSWRQTSISRIDADGEVVAQTTIDPPFEHSSPRSAFTTAAGLSFITGGGFHDSWWAAVEAGRAGTPQVTMPEVGLVSGISAGPDEGWFVAQTHGEKFIENNELVRMDAEGQVLATIPLPIEEGPRWGSFFGFALHALRDGFLLTNRSPFDADFRLEWFDASGVPIRELTLPGIVNEFAIVPLELPDGDIMLMQGRDPAKLDLTRIDDAGIACTRTFDMPPQMGNTAYGGAFDGDTFYLLVVDGVLVFRGAFTD